MPKVSSFMKDGFPKIRRMTQTEITEIANSAKKTNAEEIAKMASGDSIKKTQEYYDELFKEIDSSVYKAHFYNPRTGARITVGDKNSAELITVNKGIGDNEEITTIYDWGELGLFKATKKTTKTNHDGLGYCNHANSELQKFSKKTGKWRNKNISHEDAYYMAIGYPAQKKVPDEKVATSMYHYFKDSEDVSRYSVYKKYQACPWMTDRHYWSRRYNDESFLLQDSFYPY